MIDPSQRKLIWQRVSRDVDRVVSSELNEIRALIEATPMATAERLAHLEQPWIPTGIPGVRAKILEDDTEQDTRLTLIEMDPGRTFPAHVHHGSEDTWVLVGDLACAERVLHKGDHARLDAHSRHGDQWTDEGCLVLILGSRRDAA